MKDYSVKRTMVRRKAIAKAKKQGLTISSFNDVNLNFINTLFENGVEFYINDGIITGCTKVLK